jgi:3-oxoacyl-[acyl-carrier protein] reductase
MSKKLEGQVAVVTGASKGIGAAIAVSPGMIETEGWHAAGISGSDFQRQVEAQTPLGRIGQPQDIAPAVVFLASSESPWTTGETLYVSGGLR